ncbi:MAG: NADH:flavin oxidoreductase [Vicinamibacterales bacterium]|nr:NADH:flavin oxidoreductase [Vicinamibacterales bacterium]
MPALLTPLSFSGLTLRNRVAMPPMWSGKATAEGLVTDAIVEYHRLRAAGGSGLVTVEHSFVHPRGRHSSTQMGIHADACLDGLTKLAVAIKAEGAVACIQISHGGSRSFSRISGMRPLAPSAVRNPREAQGEIPDAASRDQIAETVQAFAAAAVRAHDAGFDAVEVHAAHGFLLGQFLSPLANLRDDEYGGDDVRRGRVLLSVIEECRRRLGQAFPLFVRLGASDERDGGFTIDAACRVASRLEAAGVALIDVSGGLVGSDDPGRGPGYFVAYASAIKQAVTIPVAVAGGISAAIQADAIIRHGHADIVCVGRAMLDDPDWARHAAAVLGGTPA